MAKRLQIKLPRLARKTSRKVGLAPGTLVHTGEQKVGSVRIRYMDYDEQHFAEQQAPAIEDCFALKTTPTITWINVDGLHDVSVVEKLGAHYGLHPLMLEDILSTGQRPKFEDYGDYAFVVLRMLTFNEQSHGIDSEQVSLILGRNVVLTFQERYGDVFDGVRNRIRNGKGRIRKMAADYLLYALIDAVVDSYFIILEKLAERIEAVEDELIECPTDATLRNIHVMKREMINLRRSIWPLREAVSALQRSETPLMERATALFIRDVYDHTVQVIDTIEGFRDMVSGMLDIYLSSISNRMNAVMKVLTIIATIFIPLTFICGIYGMNFEGMPELGWKYGYLGIWCVMIAVAVVMLLYFRKKRWL